MISQQKVILVHGYNTTPNGAWFPWLMGEVKKLAVFAVSLDMPTPAIPLQTEWVSEIARAVERHKGSEVYLVGHSLGVAAILDYLQSEGAHHVRGAVLVSGRITPGPNLATVGFYQVFDYEKIKGMMDGCVVIHATDDDMVPYENGVTLSAGLNCELVTLATGKHLGDAQTTALEPVLDALLKLGLYSERNHT